MHITYNPNPNPVEWDNGDLLTLTSPTLSKDNKNLVTLTTQPLTITHKDRTMKMC